MKKIIIIFIVVFAFAEIKSLNDLFSYIFPLITHKKIVKVYTLPRYYDYFKTNNFILVKDCNKSDIVVGNIQCKNKPIFALSYTFFKNNKNVFGVFYYRKGRPQLKFKQKILKKFFKTVPKELMEYVE